MFTFSSLNLSSNQTFFFILNSGNCVGLGNVSELLYHFSLNHLAVHWEQQPKLTENFLALSFSSNHLSAGVFRTCASKMAAVPSSFPTSSAVWSLAFRSSSLNSHWASSAPWDRRTCGPICRRSSRESASPRSSHRQSSVSTGRPVPVCWVLSLAKNF